MPPRRRVSAADRLGAEVVVGLTLSSHEEIIGHMGGRAATFHLPGAGHDVGTPV